jgi:uncharacterized YigZ family protein
MQKKEFYNTIETAASTEFKDRGSRFIAYAYPISSVEEFKMKLAELKKEHPKATHHCFAYRLGLDGNNFRSSDAGEPSGTAGKPILGQIDTKMLTNTLVVVVRYFGGSLLGVPGLINAYKSATALVLQLTPVIQKPVENLYGLHFDYTQLNEVMGVVKQYQCSVISQEAQLFYEMKVGVPLNREEEVIYKLKQIRNIDLKKI